MAVWLKADGTSVILNVRVVPRASRNGVGEPVGDSLKIRLQAPPVDGKANEALREFLSDALGIPVRAITLIAGQTGRMKRIRIEGLSPTAVQTALSIQSK